MNRWRLMIGAGILGLLLSIPPANAVMVSVDVDPSMAGIQSMKTVTQGSSFTIDVVVTELTDTLQSFIGNLTFVPAVLSGSQPVSGGFLPNAFVLNSITPPVASFSEFNAGVSTATGDGVLASITFDAVGLGMSELVLGDVRLTGTTGVPFEVFEIAPVLLENGKITVTAVPTPASLPLLLTGLVGLVGVRRLMS